MSGGTWDCYPYYKEAEEILEYIEFIESMVKKCREDDKQDIANELDDFAIHLKSVLNSIKIRFERIKGLMKAIDYKYAGDSSWDYAEDELKKLRGMDNDWSGDFETQL